MTLKLRIAIITHEIDSFQNSAYLLNHLCSIWKKNGVEVIVIKGSSEELPSADLAILHTDMTVVGDDYIRIINHYPKVLNGAVTDISKTAFSDLLVGRDDGYRGQVVVKTNANFGGMRERQEKLLNHEVLSTIDIQRPWRRVEWLEEYPVFDSPNRVPNGVWRNPRLVVEKFLPEQNDQDQYLLKIWIFFGDQEIYYQCVSDQAIIKSHNVIRREFLDTSEVPASMREIRARLGFDFGKFDFALSDGTAVLYDVNRTPGAPQKKTRSESAEKSYRILAAGLSSFANDIKLDNFET